MRTIVGFVALVGLVLAASGAKDAPGQTQTVSFSADIQPILNDHCLACHQTGSSEQGLNLEEGKAWQSLVGVRSKESKLALVESGQPDQSYMFHKIQGSQKNAGGGGVQMPIGDPLSPANIAEVRRWIAAGAPRN